MSNVDPKIAEVVREMAATVDQLLDQGVPIGQVILKVMTLGMDQDSAMGFVHLVVERREKRAVEESREREMAAASSQAPNVQDDPGFVLRTLGEYSNQLLDQGDSVPLVVLKLGKLGVDQDTATRIVNAVLEIRLESQTQQSPQNQVESTRLVACERCSAKLSDVALTCPSCGHPQPKQEESKGLPCATCRFCRTFNRIYFGDSSKTCRGCGRLLKEACETEYVDHAIDAVCANATEIGRLVGIGSCILIGLILGILGWLSSGEFYGLAGCFILGVIMLGIPVYYITFGIAASFIKSRGYIHGFGLPSEFRSHFTEGWWKNAEYRYDQKVGSTKKHGPMYVILVISLLFFGIGYLLSPTKREKKDDSAGSSKLLTSHLTARVDPGVLSHDLHLLNSDGVKEVEAGQSRVKMPPVGLSRCELSLTVLFDNGTKLPVKRYWETWAIGETKTVNVPANGNVERLEITGTVFRSDGSTKEDVNLYFSFGQGRKPK